MKSEKQKEKLIIPVPVRLLVHVPVEIDEYVDEDDLTDDKFGIPVLSDKFDHRELALKALRASVQDDQINNAVGLLASAGHALMKEYPEINCHISQFADVAPDVKLELGE